MQAIGILYPGDMGHNVGRVLKEDGFAVVTTLVGRSKRTRQLNARAGITELDSLAAVVEQADIILSIIPPTAARAVSRDFAHAVQQANRRPLFVDANAVSPMTVGQVGETIRAAGCDFLDACIIGPARDVRGRCTVYVSGPHVRAFEAALGQSLRLHPLGDAIGQASAFKMLFSGLNKGLVAVLSELTVAAQEYDFLDDLLACYTELFPGSCSRWNGSCRPIPFTPPDGPKRCVSWPKRWNTCALPRSWRVGRSRPWPRLASST